MATKVVMPRLSLTMKEGTVGKWYKKEGEAVLTNEPIVEIMSEKATYDLESPTSGVLKKILVEAGMDVPVNATLAYITAPDEILTDTVEAEKKNSGIASEPCMASPAAKRMARESNVDLSSVTGSGQDGRIDVDDVKRFVEQSRERTPKVRQSVTLAGLQKTVAERLSSSYRTAPHSTVAVEVNTSMIVNIHEKENVSLTAILVKLTAEALKEHPKINSSLIGDEIRIFEDVNIGVATATENGLIVPVIWDADIKKLSDIASEIEDLSMKAREGKLTSKDITGGTFTITNLGMWGVDFFIPIINPPQAAILAVGRIIEKPVVVDGIICVKPMSFLTLAYDHRIIDGAPAGAFLRRLRERIESYNLPANSS